MKPFLFFQALKEQNLKTENNRAGDVAQVVEHLPSKYYALNSNPSTPQNK
jgi:hypothetical protein